MKLKEKETIFILNEIKKAKLLKEENTINNLIEISSEDIKSINNYLFYEYNNDDIINWIKSKITNDLSKGNISCDVKLSEVYFKENGIHLSKTKIYYI